MTKPKPSDAVAKIIDSVDERARQFAHGNSKVAPGLWRNVVELSCMSNNDEVVFYSKNQFLWSDNLKDYFPSSPMREPQLVVSRPVFHVELDQGLMSKETATTYPRPEEAPAVSLFLDAFFKIQRKMALKAELRKLGSKVTSSQVLADYIAYSYYDCMSGGMPKYELLILCEALRSYDVDLSTEVYPGKNKSEWYTLQDFLESTKEFYEKNKTTFGQLISDSKLKLLE